MKVNEYVLKELETKSTIEVAEHMGISIPMVSQYKKGGYNASLSVAKTVYSKDKIALFPFSKDALEELNK